MRLLDAYATNTGSTIDKPYIYTKFFPVPDKYITIQSQTPYDSRNYSYWNEVIDIIKPYLDKENIKIVQVGNANESYIPHTVNFLGKTDINQLAYVISNSILHFGADSFCVHLASHYNKPIVSLYSISNPNVAGPHFGDKNKHKLIKAYENLETKKPSYSKEESPKSIDTVKPEEIAENILNFLNIKSEYKYESLIFGEQFCSNILELVPDRILNPDFAKNSLISMRIDLCKNIDENLIFNNLKLRKFIIILNQNKKINPDILHNLKENIVQIVFDCTDNEPDLNYIKAIVSSGHSPVILYKGDDKNYFNSIKIKLIDLNIKFIHAKHNEKNIDLFKKIDHHYDDIYIKSNRVILSEDKAFLSESHLMEGKNSDINSSMNSININSISDKTNLIKEINFFYIYRKTKNA